MPVTVKGSGGGSVTLDASTAAADTTLTLPNVSGTILQSGTAVTAAQGGTGLTSPGTAGNVLTSNGTAWTSTAPATTGVNVQTFTGSGTWTKPAYSASSRVYIQAWGGGASGGRGTAGGGGGGGYNERWVTLSAMGATETITIGAGGTAVTAVNTAGNAGGNTTVGSLITAYGGGGGGTSAHGGGGGGQLSAGTTANGTSAPYGGKPYGMSAAIQQGACSPSVYWLGPGGGGGWVSGLFNGVSQTLNNGLDGFMHGGGGGNGTNSSSAGGNSVWGGGGGGGGNGNGAAGTSSFGGAGGAGSTSGTPGSGTQPGGGGGGTYNGSTSGAGAAGQVIITVFPA